MPLIAKEYQGCNVFLTEKKAVIFDTMAKADATLGCSIEELCVAANVSKAQTIKHIQQLRRTLQAATKIELQRVNRYRLGIKDEAPARKSKRRQ